MQGTRRGFSIKTFLAEGDPDGLQIIEHSQWIGRGVIIPRARFETHLDRATFDGTGIYLLAGVSPTTGIERIGIGTTAELRDDRARVQSMPFWNRLIALSADGQRLHRGHCDYIVSRLIESARELMATELENATDPASPALAEPDRADADYFCDQLTLIMPMLGVHAFESPPEQGGAGETRLSGKGVIASGYAAEGRFVVRAGSGVSRQDSGSCPGHIADLRRSLIERGALEEDSKNYKLVRDLAFDSPTKAATLVLGEMSTASAWKDLKGSGAAPTGATPVSAGASGQTELKPTAVQPAGT